MNQIKASISFILLIIFWGPYVQAGILADLNQMFLSNASPPGTITTKDRVGVMGGSLSVRSPVRSVSVVAFDPPRLDAGCGGVDLYGGSFTFINHQQLTQLFRQIGQGASGLIFKSGIKLINPQLDALITEFQTTVQSLNNLRANTCNMAAALISRSESIGNSSINGEGVESGVQKGFFADAIAGLNSFMSDGNAYLKKTGEVNAKVGNSTVKALMSSSAAASLQLPGVGNIDGSSDDASDVNTLNNKLLVSLLGWEVNGVPCSSQNEVGTADASPIAGSNNLGRISCRGNATLKLDQLYKGGGTGSSRPANPLTLYRCVNPSGNGMPNGGFDPQICTTMAKENFNYPGIQGWANTMFFGSPTAETVEPDSIVGKFNAGSTLRMSDLQRRFIKMSGLPIISLMGKTTNSETRSAIAQKLSVYLADCLTARIGEALYKAMNSIQYGNSYVLTEDIKANIEHMRVDYMASQNACLRDSATLRVSQELTLASNLNGNNK